MEFSKAYLKSNMDRFIAIFNSRDFSSCQNLKSNMDRFIAAEANAKNLEFFI